jgi:hypothetical protein
MNLSLASSDPTIVRGVRNYTFALNSLFGEGSDR